MSIARALACLACVGLGTAAMSGCDKKGARDAAGTTTTAVAAPTVLTMEKLKEARAAVKLPGKLAAALPAVEPIVGRATRVSGGRHSWVWKSGEDCHELAIEAAADGELRAVGIQSASRFMPSMYAKCTGEPAAPAKPAPASPTVPTAPAAPSKK